jgi:hypothetical protein
MFLKLFGLRPIGSICGSNGAPLEESDVTIVSNGFDMLPTC